MADDLVGKISAYYAKMGKQGKILLIAAVSFVFLAVMDRLILGPILAQLKEIDKEIELKMQTIHRSQRILSFKDGILKEYLKYTNYLQSSDQEEEEIIAEHLQEIETLATVQQVSISKIEAGTVNENPLMREYQIAIECEGTLGNILAFISSLEDSEFLFQIRNFTLTPKTKTGEIIKGLLNISRIFVVSEDIAPVQEML